ncbi:oligosaccharide flippase family protein [Candidatus Bathyarchaeota archaeon A05DMB-2]|jgi:O-antigen/teichoic acid export membrane protein|nr:oligosaccharide flippase family protein [Candidatus Bathyarchaeota archaeon A05DMB-2]
MAQENEIMQVAESSAHGGMYLFIGNALSTGILAVSSIIIGRLLGPDNYGLFSLAIVVPSLLVGLIDFGIVSAITRFCAKFRAEGNDCSVRRVVKYGIIFELIVGLIASLFCFTFSDSLSLLVINRPEAGFYVRIGSFLILFQALFNVISAAFIGLNREKINVLVMAVRAFTKFSLSPLLIIVGFGIFGALLGHVVCYVIAVAVGVVYLSLLLYKGHTDDDPSPGIFKTMLRYGAPLYISGLLGLFLLQYQTIILAHFASNAEIGNFQVATLFETAMAVLSYPFIALFPAFSKLTNENGQLGQFFRRSVKYTAMLVIPATIAIAVLANDIIYVFYGSDFTLAPTFVAFYILLNLFAGFGTSVLGYLFNGIGRTDVALKSALINFVVFLPASLILTFLFGVMGLIGSLFVCSFFTLTYSLAVTYKQVKTFPDLQSSARIYAASALSALALFGFLKISPFSSFPNLVLGCAIFFFLYLTLLPIIGVLTFTDLDLFKQLFLKIKGVRIALRLLISYETKILSFTRKQGNEN